MSMQFVSKIIQDALQTGPYREGSRPCVETCDDETPGCLLLKKKAEVHPCNEGSDVQVQHFSLPWGGSCHQHPNPPLVDVVLPSPCTRDQLDETEIEECKSMRNDIWGLELDDGKPVQYPIRYQLDITTHKEWYDAHGVDQWVIIVVRDDNISFAARHSHCNDVKLRKEEEEVGTQLIVDAINKFILEDSDSQVNSNTLKHWVAEKYQVGAEGRRILSALPSNNKVVVLSYESLVKLGSTYVRMLYETLGIQSDSIPEILDSNQKYLNLTYFTR